MNGIIKWFGALFLVASTALTSFTTKTIVSPTPKPIDCVINGIKTTAISQEICDGWTNRSTPTITQTLLKKVVQPTVDPDPPVHCKMSAECGGGTTPLKQSECNNSTCCQIGNKWIFYKDKNQCIRDQGGSLNNSVPKGTTINSKILCKFSGSGYSYDFGEITYDECRNKTDAYWASQNQSAPAMLPSANNNAELRDQCLGNIQREYQSSLNQIRIGARAEGSSTSQAEYLLNKDYVQKENDCKSRYPIN